MNHKKKNCFSNTITIKRKIEAFANITLSLPTPEGYSMFVVRVLETYYQKR